MQIFIFSSFSYLDDHILLMVYGLVMYLHGLLCRGHGHLHRPNYMQANIEAHLVGLRHRQVEIGEVYPILILKAILCLPMEEEVSTPRRPYMGGHGYNMGWSTPQPSQWPGKIFVCIL